MRQLWKSTPLRVKAPVIVAALTVCVAVIISQVVMARLTENQEKSLHQLTSAYLDGVATSVLPHVIRRDVWETFDALSRSRQLYQGLNVQEVIVSLADGRILASSDPMRFPVAAQLPQTVLARFDGGRELIIDDDRAMAWVRRVLVEGGEEIGSVFARLDLGPLMRERRQVLWALIGVNGLLTVIFAAIGYFTVHRLLRPVSILHDHMERLKSGDPSRFETADISRQDTEFASLFRQFNAAVDAIEERKILAQRLADEEKLALLGKLASAMAHEVNNPLGGMMNALSTLKKHGGDEQVREQSIGLIERGLRGIRHVVRAALVSYRGVKGARDGDMLTARDLDDLKFLIQHETLRRKLKLSWHNRIPESVAIDGSAIRQAVLNILLNACEASSVGGSIVFEAALREGNIEIAISDSGPGLPEDVRRMYENAGEEDLQPVGSSGLGIWTAARLIGRLGGHFSINDAEGRGCRIAFTVPVREKKAYLHDVA